MMFISLNLIADDRICPGRYFADDSVWLAIASVLHAFTLSSPDGTRTDISGIQWASGLVKYVHEDGVILHVYIDPEYLIAILQHFR